MNFISVESWRGDGITWTAPNVTIPIPAFGSRSAPGRTLIAAIGRHLVPSPRRLHRRRDAKAEVVEYSATKS